MIAALTVHGQPTAFVTSKRTSPWPGRTQRHRDGPPGQPDRHRHHDDGSLRHGSHRDVDRLEGRSERRATESAAKESCHLVAPDGLPGQSRPEEHGPPVIPARASAFTSLWCGLDVGTSVNRWNAFATEAATQATRTMTPTPTTARPERSEWREAWAVSLPGRFVEDGVGHGTTSSSEPTARTPSPRLPRP